MKPNYRILRTSVITRSLAVLGTLIIAQSAICPAHATTTIGFDGAGFTDGDPIPQLFASDAQFDGPGFTVSMGRVFTGTPHITVWWIEEGPMTFRSDWDGRGSVAQLYPPSGPYSLGLVFMGDLDHAAIVDSFDLDLRSGAGPADVDWSFQGSGFSASGNWQRATPGRDTITPSYIGEPDFMSGDYFFFLKINSGDPGSFAIDNLTFDEVLVPEPSTLALVSLGSLALVIWRRRR